MRLMIILLTLAGPAAAQQFNVLAGDEALSRVQVSELTQDAVITFYEGGTSRYSTGGAYSYSYASGATAFGTFEVGPEGTVCIAFRNGRSRCDRFVRSHGRLVLLTEDGGRFPVRGPAD